VGLPGRVGYGAALLLRKLLGGRRRARVRAPWAPERCDDSRIVAGRVLRGCRWVWAHDLRPGVGGIAVARPVDGRGPAYAAGATGGDRDRRHSRMAGKTGGASRNRARAPLARSTVQRVRWRQSQS